MKKRAVSILLALVLILPAMLASFSPALAAEPVARIGEQGYSDLRTAFAALRDGDTLTLLKSVVLEPTLETGDIEVPFVEMSEGDHITIDGGGFTISGPELNPEEAGLLNLFGGSADIRNLNLEAAGNIAAGLLLFGTTATLTDVYAYNLGDETVGLIVDLPHGEGPTLLGEGESIEPFVTIVSGAFGTGLADSSSYAIWGSQYCKLASGSSVSCVLPLEITDWQNTDATYVEIIAGGTLWSGFSGAPCMLIEVKDASGNPIKETGFVISRKPGAVVGASFVAGSETKCTDKNGKLGFSGISGVTYIITTKDGKSAEFVFSADKSISVTMN